MVKTTLTPDLCVLGGGHAAASIAAQAAALGLRTVLVREGGEGAPPSRQVHFFAAAAAAGAAARRAARFGFDAPVSALDFARLRGTMQETLADLARNESDMRLRALGVGVIPYPARFVDPVTVAAGDFEVRARRFLVVPSFAPVIPPVRGLARNGHLTADRLGDLRELPLRLAVIGAGATGLSLAQSFRRLGSEVTVLEAAAPLAGEDRECAEILLRALAREGIEIRSGVEVQRVDGKRGALRIGYRQGADEHTLDATHLLAACGWRAELDSLSLDQAELDTARLAAGGDLRTSNSRVYIAGDGPAAPQADAWYARIVLANLLLRTPLRADRSLVARATATAPSLAHAGLREDEARAKHRRVQVLRWPFAENEAAAIAGDDEGMIKLVTTRGGKLLGATIVGEGAADLIGACAVAIHRRQNLRALAGPLFPHPGRAEAVQRAALAGLAAGLTSPVMQRIIAAMRWFG